MATAGHPRRCSRPTPRCPRATCCSTRAPAAAGQACLDGRIGRGLRAGPGQVPGGREPARPVRGDGARPPRARVGAHIQRRPQRHGLSARPRVRPCRPARSRAVALDEELDCVFWAFPNDRRIRDLMLLAEPWELGHLLGRPRADARLVAYVPESCATARCVDEGGRTLAYAKVYAGGGAERAQSCARRYRIPFRRARASSGFHGCSGGRPPGGPSCSSRSTGRPRSTRAPGRSRGHCAA